MAPVHRLHATSRATSSSSPYRETEENIGYCIYCALYPGLSDGAGLGKYFGGLRPVVGCYYILSVQSQLGFFVLVSLSLWSELLKITFERLCCRSRVPLDARKSANYIQAEHLAFIQSYDLFKHIEEEGGSERILPGTEVRHRLTYQFTNFMKFAKCIGTIR